MAVALRNAARLKPEIELSRALQEFESILDKDQKAQFDVFKKESPPGASAPLAFTCLLDRRLENSHSRRRIGSKALNLLQGAQQFSAVLDVFIGGSQNILASSVWGIVKLSLQVGSNYSQYFDKLSGLLLDVGRSCPQFQEFGILFVESKGLQRALCSYFTAIIDLCKHIVLFTHKSFLAQLPKLILPFDAAFSDITATLQRLSEAIRDEVSLASSKHQKLEYSYNAGERGENARFRTLMTRFKDQSLAELRHLNQNRARPLRLDFLATLSSYNYVTSWKQARSKGCAEWVLKTEPYQRWKTTDSNGTFRLVGKLGSGKTILAATVIADLAIEEHQAKMCYFFCNFDDAISLKAKTVISSLAKQILLEIEFEPPRIASSIIDLDDPVELLLSLLPHQSEKRYIICLDGIDECEASERDQILSALKRICHALTTHCKIFYSVRPNSQLATERSLPADESISMSHDDRDQEIAAYVKSTLEHKIEQGALTLGDHGLIFRIVEQLSKKADGMYLWVYFQLQAICEQTTDNDIIQTLNDLPEDMHKTYARVLSRLKQQRTLTCKVFETIASCGRPFSTEELREVLAVEIGELTLKPGSLVNDIAKTLALCGGSLLVIDEEDSTVRFVHESIRQFLTNDIEGYSEISHYHIDSQKADLSLGLRCVTYLNMGFFNTQLTKAKNSAPWKGLSPNAIVTSSLGDNTITKQLAMKFLKADKNVDCDIAVQLERLAALRNRPAELTFAFLPYAKDQVFTHTKQLLEVDPKLDSLFVKTFNGHLPFIPTPWTRDIHSPDQQRKQKTESLATNVISWAIDHDHFGLLYRTLRVRTLSRGVLEVCDEFWDKFSDNSKFSKREEAILQTFQLAFARQRTDVIKFLLRTLHQVLRPSASASLLFPIIAHGGELIGEWVMQGGSLKSSDGLPSVAEGYDLESHGVGIQSKAMRVYRPQNSTVSSIQEFGVDCSWDIFALAAAYDNMEAIHLIENSRILDYMKEQMHRVLLRAVREASSRDHVAMVKYLLSSYSTRLREDYMYEPPDKYGWTLLHYAAALSDPTVYLTFVSAYQNKSPSVDIVQACARSGPNPQMIFDLARSYVRPIWNFDASEKEIVSIAPAYNLQASEAYYGHLNQKEEEILGWGPDLLPDSPVTQRPAISHVDAAPDRNGHSPPQSLDAVVQPQRRSIESYYDLPAAGSNTAAAKVDRAPVSPVSSTATRKSQPRQSPEPSTAKFSERPHPITLLRPSDSSIRNALKNSQVSKSELMLDGISYYPLTGPILAREKLKLAQDRQNPIVVMPRIELCTRHHPPKRGEGLFSYTSPKRRSNPPRRRMLASRLDERSDLQSQVLQAQSAAIEAQAAVLKMSSRGGHAKSWWEMPVPVLAMCLVFAMCMSILTCCAIFMMRRPELGWSSGRSCAWDERVEF